jgi:membrane protease YdiL (CAAX protease family)
MRVSEGLLSTVVSSYVVTLLAAVVAGSLWTWSAIARRLRDARVVLPYEPRRDVPWEPVQILCVFFCGLMLPVLVVASARGAYLISEPIHVKEIDPRVYARITAGFALAELVAVGAGVLILVATAGARAKDLGLPTSFRTFIEDFYLGFVAFLAVIVPVYMVKFITTGVEARLWGQPSEHPLLKMLSQEWNWQTMAAASVAAVVAAPVFEEFSFRLVLQGWLEKLDHRLRRRSTPVENLDAMGSLTSSSPAFSPSSAASETSPSAETASPPAEAEPEIPCGGPSAARRWWSLPVLTSSALFAMMHVGTGLDPIPLFTLGLALGYVYQRTHRILPCMLLHALFNGFSLGIFLLLLPEGSSP